MPLLTMKQIMADSVKLATTDVDPKERYAVGAFNFSTIPEMVGIVEGAREKNAPVILMASLGAIKYLSLIHIFPVFLDHDVQSAALVEQLYGNGQGYQDVLVLGIEKG